MAVISSRRLIYFITMLMLLIVLLGYRLSIAQELKIFKSKLEGSAVVVESLSLKHEVYKAHIGEFLEQFDYAALVQSHQVLLLDEVQKMVEKFKLEKSRFQVDASENYAVDIPVEQQVPVSPMRIQQYKLQLGGAIRHEGMLLDVVNHLVRQKRSATINQSCLLARSNWMATSYELPKFATVIVRDAISRRSYSDVLDPINELSLKSIASSERRNTDLQYHCSFVRFQITLDRLATD